MAKPWTLFRVTWRKPLPDFDLGAIINCQKIRVGIYFALKVRKLFLLLLKLIIFLLPPPTHIIYYWKYLPWHFRLTCFFPLREGDEDWEQSWLKALFLGRQGFGSGKFYHFHYVLIHCSVDQLAHWCLSFAPLFIVEKTHTSAEHIYRITTSTLSYILTASVKDDAVLHCLLTNQRQSLTCQGHFFYSKPIKKNPKPNKNSTE